MEPEAPQADLVRAPWVIGLSGVGEVCLSDAGPRSRLLCSPASPPTSRRRVQRSRVVVGLAQVQGHPEKREPKERGSGDADSVPTEATTQNRTTLRPGPEPKPGQSRTNKTDLWIEGFARRIDWNSLESGIRWKGSFTP